jgi:hypothetical protein
MVLWVQTQVCVEGERSRYDWNIGTWEDGWEGEWCRTRPQAAGAARNPNETDKTDTSGTSLPAPIMVRLWRGAGGLSRFPLRALAIAKAAPSKEGSWGLMLLIVATEKGK